MYEAVNIGTSLKDLLGGSLENEIKSKTQQYGGEHFEIVSRVGYLIGVDKRYFREENTPMQLQIYNIMERSNPARIIRALCALRTQLEICFLKVCHAIQREHRSIMNMPEYIPTHYLQVLEDANIDLYKFRNDPGKFMVELNRNIQNRINNCKSLFPEWIAWDYLSRIFIMPNGLSEEGTKKEADKYYKYQNLYPYKAYINWEPEENGNILWNDKKFVNLLYSWNGDEFYETNLVSDVSDNTKSRIYDFIDRSEKTVFVVDCENSDPYSLCAAISNLESEKLDKINKIILYDDKHAASAWDSFNNYIDLPVEYIKIERLKDNKSLADVKLTAGVCMEYFRNNVDSFVLVSSDSDYWGLIESIPQARFLVMVEHRKFSPVMREALSSRNIFYCFIDDFYAGGNEQKIKTDALLREINKIFARTVDINIHILLEEALEGTRILMSQDEKLAFIKNHITNRILIESNPAGDLSLKLRV